MDGLIQVYLMFMILALYAAIGSLPMLIYMALVTYIKKDKAYFRKKIDKLIGD